LSGIGNKLEEPPVLLTALIFVVFVLLPIGFIWSGIKLIYNNFRFRKDAVVVAGTVVEIKQAVLVSGNGAVAKFKPVFESKSPTGEMLRSETTSASKNYDFPQHSEHKILVNFHKPEIVQMPGDRAYLKPIAMIAVAGTILFAGGSFMLSLS